jgi:hypothetical protein
VGVQRLVDAEAKARHFVAAAETDGAGERHWGRGRRGHCAYRSEVGWMGWQDVMISSYARFGCR